MEKYNDDTVMFSSLLSGILLFKREVSNNEILSIMYHYEDMYNVDVIDDELPSDIYYLINMNDKGVSVNSFLDYNSIIVIDNKKISFKNYLRKNTTLDIINYLEHNVYGCKPIGLKNNLFLFEESKKEKVKEKKVTFSI